MTVDSDLLKNRYHLLSFLDCCDKTTLIVKSESSALTLNGAEISDKVRIGAVINFFFNAVNVYYWSGSQIQVGWVPVMLKREQVIF